jgi:hypothetical protein
MVTSSCVDVFHRTVAYLHAHTWVQIPSQNNGRKPQTFLNWFLQHGTKGTFISLMYRICTWPLYTVFSCFMPVFHSTIQFGQSKWYNAYSKEIAQSCYKDALYCIRKVKWCMWHNTTDGRNLPTHVNLKHYTILQNHKKADSSTHSDFCISVTTKINPTRHENDYCLLHTAQWSTVFSQV